MAAAPYLPRASLPRAKVPYARPPPREPWFGFREQLRLLRFSQPANCLIMGKGAACAESSRLHTVQSLENGLVAKVRAEGCK